MARNPTELTSLEELLLTDTSTLAICIFLFNHNSKVDLEDIYQAFNSKATIDQCLENLLLYRAIEKSFTGKGRRPRIALSSSGKDIVNFVIEASKELRMECAKELNSVSLDGNMAIFQITSVSYAPETNQLKVDSNQTAQPAVIEFKDRANFEVKITNALVVDNKTTSTSQAENNRNIPLCTYANSFEIKYDTQENKRLPNIGRNPWRK